MAYRVNGSERKRIAHDVPIVLTGYVRPNDMPSFCRDGADYWVETVGWHKHVRVCAANEEASCGLAEAVSTGDAWAISGLLKRGPIPGCDLLEVYAVDPVDWIVQRWARAPAPSTQVDDLPVHQVDAVGLGIGGESGHAQDAPQ